MRNKRKAIALRVGLEQVVRVVYGGIKCGIAACRFMAEVGLEKLVLLTLA